MQELTPKCLRYVEVSRLFFLVCGKIWVGNLQLLKLIENANKKKIFGEILFVNKILGCVLLEPLGYVECMSGKSLVSKQY